MDPTERARRVAALAGAEQALLAEKKRIAAERRALGGEELPDFTLVSAGGEPLTLASAFGSHRDLLLVHNMGRSCAWCTLWADGIQGLLPHLADRCALLLVSPDPPAVQREFAASRGWTLPIASAAGTDFIRRLGFQDQEGRFIPGVSALRKEGARIERVAHTTFGPGDDFCSVWHFFDLLAGGAADWQPRFSYEEAGA